MLVATASILRGQVRSSVEEIIPDSLGTPALYAHTPTRTLGYAEGVSGAIAFIATPEDTSMRTASARYLVMGGGCNFPELSPSQGGRKAFYTELYSARLDREPLSWRSLAPLPEPVAYSAICQTSPESLVVAGGTTPSGATRLVYRLRLGTAGSSIEPLPALPEPRSGASLVYVSGRLYLIGGQVSGRSTTSMLSLGEGESHWRREPSYPGDALLKVLAFAVGGEIHLLGSVSGVEGDEPARLAQSWHIYNTDSASWCTQPYPVAFGEATFGGGSVVSDGRQVYLTGGVAGGKFLPAIQREQEIRRLSSATESLTLAETERLSHLRAEARRYLSESVEAYRFERRLWRLSPDGRSWQVVHPGNHLTARADGVLLLDHAGDRLLMVGGEIKPGVRSPIVSQIPLHPTHP